MFSDAIEHRRATSEPMELAQSCMPTPQGVTKPKGLAGPTIPLSV